MATVVPITMWTLRCPQPECHDLPVEVYSSRAEADRSQRVHDRYHAEDNAAEIARLEALWVTS